MFNLSKFEHGEILDIVVEIETKGADFYKMLAENAQYDKLKEALLFLAKEEEKHKNIFRKLLSDEFNLINPRETYEGEYFEYLKHTVQTHMFSDSEWMEKMINAADSEK